MPGVLTFDEAAHAYALDGAPMLSVTQVLEGVGIIDYSGLPEHIRERALARGRAVHVATHYDDEGALDEATVAPGVTGYLEAWRRFRRESGFVPELIEHRGFHQQYPYAGTLDRTGRLANGSEVLLDIKSGTAEWWVRVQLAAYAAFFEHPRKWRRMSVELHGDGTYRNEEFPCRGWQSDFNVFLAALTVAEAKRRHSK